LESIPLLLQPTPGFMPYPGFSPLQARSCSSDSAGWAEVESQASFWPLCPIRHYCPSSRGGSRR